MAEGNVYLCGLFNCPISFHTDELEAANCVRKSHRMPLHPTVEAAREARLKAAVARDLGFLIEQAEEYRRAIETGGKTRWNLQDIEVTVSAIRKCLTDASAKKGGPNQ